MSDDAKILIVEDDAFNRDLFEAALEDKYRLLQAENGRDALMIAAAECPDLILLDVELPDVDGYEVARQLRQRAVGGEVPVIFVSGRDRIEDRLQGYEAGGDDYVVKPFEREELLAKIGRLLRSAAERKNLDAFAQSASQTAITAMTSMSEMGALLQALQSFGACADHTALADAMLAGLGLYGLKGIAQVRGADGATSRNARGVANPLESAAVSHMAGMERIVQFRNRLAVNYPHVTLMVQDMPVDDPDRCGRLRDHLAVLAESAEGRATAIDAALAAQQRKAALGRIADRLIATLADIDTAQRQSRTATQLAVEDFNSRLLRAFGSLALSEGQENMVAGIAAAALDRVVEAQSSEIDLQDRLSSIIGELKDIAAAEAVPGR